MIKTINSLKRIDAKVYFLLIKYIICFDFAAIKNLVSVYLIRFSPPPAYKPQIFFNGIQQNELLEFRRYEHPVVSIVIPTFNQWGYTLACLHAIHANSGTIPYEVIVADDGSTDETRNIRDHVANITVLSNEQNLQYLRNCNQAARHAAGKYLLFLNNDTLVQQHWLFHLLDMAEGDDTVGVIGAKLVYPDGRLQEAGGIIWRDGAGWNYGWYDDPQKPAYNYAREVDYVSGACLMVRKDAWEKVGGFDERFAPAYYEDTDLAFLVRRLGYKVMYQPKAVVVHFEGISSGTSLSAGVKHYQKLNRIKFVEKWQTVLAKEHFDRGRNLAMACDRGKGTSN